jgi:hypothetical protein
VANRHHLSVFILGAVLSASAVAEAAGSDPTTATPPQKQEAQDHFSKAHDLFERKQFSQALDEARASWGVVASPNARILMARCLRESGRLAEAYREYSATIDDANALATKEARYADTAKAAKDERTAVEPAIAMLTVQVDYATDDTRVIVAGQPLARDAWSTAQPENPGTLDIVVEVGGKEVARQAPSVAAGDKKTVHFDAHLTPAAVAPAPLDKSDEPDLDKEAKAEVAPTPPRAGNGLRTSAYVVGGVGAAGLLVFGIFGAMDDSTFSGLQNACLHNACPPSKSSDISTGKTQQLVANIGLGVGIAGVAAGATLFVISLRAKSSASKSDATTSLVVSPSFIGLRGAL